ncbi:MAG: hypothetical protein AAGI23_00430 [Bacteroidota bacterium]
MTSLNTKYIIILGIILTLFVSAGSNQYDISSEQSDQLYSIAEEKVTVLEKIEKLEDAVAAKLVVMEEEGKWTQSKAVIFSQWQHQAATIKIAKQSVLNNHWQNWTEKKNQIRRLIYRTNKRL